MTHRPRKRFGQNFLQDSNIIFNIVNAINPQPKQHVVEIGPGLGAITKLLLDKVDHLDVIELDNDLITNLNSLHAEKITVHHCDVLKFDFSTLNKSPLRIVGNLPYNISTPLCFHLLAVADKITDMHFMLQKEVVERMCSAPNQKSYGRLSVMIQYYCQAQTLFNVPPSAFYPKPKVDSAIIRLTPYQEKPCLANDEQQFAEMVKLAFSQPRKTLRNNLKAVYEARLLDSCPLDLSLRPGTINVADYVSLANYLLDEK